MVNWDEINSINDLLKESDLPNRKIVELNEIKGRIANSKFPLAVGRARDIKQYLNRNVSRIILQCNIEGSKIPRRLIGMVEQAYIVPENGNTPLELVFSGCSYHTLEYYDSGNLNDILEVLDLSAEAVLKGALLIYDTFIKKGETSKYKKMIQRAIRHI
jgi:hypothetical protein